MQSPYITCVAVVLAAVWASGCTLSVPIDAKAPVVAQPDAMLPIKVGLLIDAETRAKEATGWGGGPSFVYPVGEALEKIASAALASVFSRVEKVNAAHPLPPGLDGTVQILIDDAFLRPTLVSGDVASSTILLRCVVYDKEGKRIATLVSRGYARSIYKPPLWAGFGRGFVPLQELLGTLADQALHRAAGELLRKLVEHDKMKHLQSPG